VTGVTQVEKITTPAAPRRRNRSKPRGRRSPGDWLMLALAVLGAFLIAAPFLLILINSFKSSADYASGGPLRLPQHIDFIGIRDFWNRVDFPLKL
jgi:raffinose/stachyose/melibiose transport system permease protein